MRSFQIGKGLAISVNGEYFEFTDRTKIEINFQRPADGKRIIYTEVEFWTELSSGTIQIVPAIVSTSALIIKDKDEVQDLINSASDLSEKYQQNLERKIKYINALKLIGISRGKRKLIEEALPKICIELQDVDPPAASTVQSWWRMLETNINGNGSLIDKNAYKSRSKCLNSESESFLQDQIQEHYVQLSRPSVSSAFTAYSKELRQTNKTREQQGRQPFQSVCLRTFYSRIKALPRLELLIGRYGYEYARKQLKVSKGPLPAKYPLDVVEIDHTLMNLYVIDDLSFLPLGRPTITAIKDRHSKILLGLYLSFHGGGLPSIAGAIKHSLTAHHLAFDLWPDLENSWPAFGLGMIYSSDRGADYFSPRYRNMILDLGANYEYCQVRTPWLKGSIERFFLTLEQTFFETLPGKTFNALVNRHGYDPAKQAVIRFSTLVYLLHKWAVDYHNVTPHSRNMATPLELWQEGISEAPPSMPMSIHRLNTILGDRQSGTLRNEGIQFLGLNYADDNLQHLVNRFGKGVEVDFVVTPDNLGTIHVKDSGTGEYVPVHCTRPDYANGLSLFQHKYIRHEAKLHFNRNNSLDLLFDTRQRIEQRVSEDIDAKSTHQKKQLARIAGINSNAVLDGEARSTKTPFPNTLTAQTQISESEESPFTGVPSYTWGD